MKVNIHLEHSLPLRYRALGGGRGAGGQTREYKDIVGSSRSKAQPQTCTNFFESPYFPTVLALNLGSKDVKRFLCRCSQHVCNNICFRGRGPLSCRRQHRRQRHAPTPSPPPSIMRAAAAICVIVLAVAAPASAAGEREGGGRQCAPPRRAGASAGPRCRCALRHRDRHSCRRGLARPSATAAAAGSRSQPRCWRRAPAAAPGPRPSAGPPHLTLSQLLLASRGRSEGPKSATVPPTAAPTRRRHSHLSLLPSRLRQ